MATRSDDGRPQPLPSREDTDESDDGQRTRRSAARSRRRDRADGRRRRAVGGRARAGVADQDPTCRNGSRDCARPRTAPCFDCVTDGGDA